MEKILILDDEVNICDSLEFALEDNYKVYTTQNVYEALKMLETENIAVVLLDMKIGEHDGLDVLKKMKTIKEDIQIIIITAFGSIKSSVNAMKQGAFHYITKPIDMEELNLYIQKALEFKSLSFSLDNLKQIVNTKYNFKEIIGNSKPMQILLDRVQKIINIDTTVLITGESGTGKDLIAKALHFQSNRKDNNFIAVNCAAIPTNLLESELFGYEKGAFTNADKKKIGKIELANNGTLFLDEIGEMDLQMQAKILRVVEDMEVTPLGSNTPTKVNLRIIAATNKNLEEEVRNNRFREDLYYRLNVITVDMPPLRHRDGDLPLLLNYFLERYNKKFKKSIKGFSKDFISCLDKYSFPGNVRELDNLIEMLVALSENRVLNRSDLPDKYQRGIHDEYRDRFDIILKMGTTLKDAEKEIILKTLGHLEGNRRITADTLQISERNLQYKLKEYNTN